MNYWGLLLWKISGSAYVRCLFGYHFYVPFGGLGRESRQFCMRCGTVKGQRRAPASPRSSAHASCPNCGKQL
jgi:hypothetical protein